MTLKLLLTGASCAFFIAFQCGAQTNAVPVVTTNWVTAVPYFREVNGKLYNTELSVLWQSFNAKCLNVSSNGILVQSFTMQPVYEAATTSVASHNYLGQVTGYRTVPTTVQVGTKEAPGVTLFLRHYPSEQIPAYGESIAFHAMRIGNIDHNGNNYELWDYGTPHVVMVVKTNFPPKLKSEISK